MVNPSKWVNLKSNFLKFHHRNQAISGIEKARKIAYFRAFLAFLSCKLSLAELQGLGADPAKHMVISSLSAWFLA